MSPSAVLPGISSQLDPQRMRRSDLLFHLRTAEANLEAISGQAATFTRATIGGAVADSKGRLRQPPHSVPSWAAVDLDGDGVRESVGLVIEPSSVNLCLQSEDFGTTWSLNNTPTRVAAALRCGALVLDLIGDDNAAGIEGYFQAIAFTGNAVKAISIFVAQATSTESIIALWDNTASADRLMASVAWTGAGIPSVTVTVGVFLGYELWATMPNGLRIWRLKFRSTSVTAANTNNLRVRPATTSAGSVANTGTLYAGGCQAENAEHPTGYVKTTTATVSRNGELLKYPFLLPPTALTTYSKFIDIAPGDSVVTQRILNIGLGTDPRILFNKVPGTPGTYQFQHRTTLGTVSSSANTGTASVGDVIEVLGVLNADGSVQATASRNGATAVVGTASAALAMPAAWNTAEIYIGSDGGNWGSGSIFLVPAKVARGVKTMAQMREAF